LKYEPPAVCGGALFKPRRERHVDVSVKRVGTDLIPLPSLGKHPPSADGTLFKKEGKESGTCFALFPSRPQGGLKRVAPQSRVFFGATADGGCFRTCKVFPIKN